MTGGPEFQYHDRIHSMEGEEKTQEEKDTIEALKSSNAELNGLKELVLEGGKLKGQKEKAEDKVEISVGHAVNILRSHINNFDSNNKAHVFALQKVLVGIARGSSKYRDIIPSDFKIGSDFSYTQSQDSYTSRDKTSEAIDKLLTLNGDPQSLLIGDWNGNPSGIIEKILETYENIGKDITISGGEKDSSDKNNSYEILRSGIAEGKNVSFNLETQLFDNLKIKVQPGNRNIELAEGQKLNITYLGKEYNLTVSRDGDKIYLRDGGERDGYNVFYEVERGKLYKKVNIGGASGDTYYLENKNNNFVVRKQINWGFDVDAKRLGNDIINTLKNEFGEIDTITTGSGHARKTAYRVNEYPGPGILNQVIYQSLTTPSESGIEDNIYDGRDITFELDEFTNLNLDVSRLQEGQKLNITYLGKKYNLTVHKDGDKVYLRDGLEREEYNVFYGIEDGELKKYAQIGDSVLLLDLSEELARGETLEYTDTDTETKTKEIPKEKLKSLTLTVAPNEGITHTLLRGILDNEDTKTWFEGLYNGTIITPPVSGPSAAEATFRGLNDAQKLFIIKLAKSIENKLPQAANDRAKRTYTIVGQTFEFNKFVWGTLPQIDQAQITAALEGNVSPNPIPVVSTNVPSSAVPEAISTETKVHTVVAGDTLGKIAKANKTTVQALMEANEDITDANKIGVGQKIKIPGQRETPTKEAPEEPEEAGAPEAGEKGAPEVEASKDGAESNTNIPEQYREYPQSLKLDGYDQPFNVEYDEDRKPFIKIDITNKANNYGGLKTYLTTMSTEATEATAKFKGKGDEDNNRTMETINVFPASLNRKIPDKKPDTVYAIIKLD